MTATTRAPAQSIPTQTAPSRDKRTLEDAAHFIGVGQTSLDWLDSDSVTRRKFRLHVS